MSPSLPLEGRLALVTGATSGIGLALAHVLHRAGARLLLVGRRAERLAQLELDLPGARGLCLDVRDGHALCEALAQEPVDIAISNAGLSIGMEPLQQGVLNDWSIAIDTNIKGVLHVIRATLPGMLERRRGDQLLIGSVAGRQIYPNGNVYIATKHAVRALYESLRLDSAGHNVRCTTIDPGMVETEFSNVRFRGDNERAAKVYQGMTPLSPADVADAVLFALTRPPHVNIGEIVLWPTDQASTTRVERRPG